MALQNTPMQSTAFKAWPGMCVALVYTRWHQDYVSTLVTGAKQACADMGVEVANVSSHAVAGAFELPQMAQALAHTKQVHAIVPLGCLIRGETIHYEVIAQTVTQALDALGRQTGVATALGVITVENHQQAKDRCGGSLGNKGYEAAQAAIELAVQIKEVSHG